MARTEASIFDIVGPVMVGPSSSHTAGIVRLGQIGRALLGQTPECARIELHGSLADTGLGHGTDRAVVAGLLGFAVDDQRIRDSLSLAREAQVQLVFETTDLGPDAHPNSLRLTLRTAGHQVMLIGASVGGGMVRITNVDGYPVDFSAEYDTLIIVAPDRPGTVNAVTSWLAANSINIAYLDVGRRRRGGEAIMVLEVDGEIPASVVSGLASLPWLTWVRRILRGAGS